jgi:O-antigen ligase
VLRTVFWSAAALGASAIVFAIVGVGALGSGAIDAFNDIPGVFRIFKPAYLTEGFVAVTNWHQDPGYSAAWMNLWAALALVAAIRRLGTGRWWADGAVIGALGLGTFMTMSRTGWVGFAAGLVATAAILAIKDRVALRPLAERLIAGALVFVVLLGIVAVVDRPDIGSDLDQAVAFRLDQRLTLDAGDAGELGGSEGVVDARSVVWPQYVDAFLDNPLRGIGLGTGWATPDMQEPHNLALELLGETGLLGLAGFIVLFGVVVYFGRGTVGAIALTVALIAAFTQTVLFEPTWWFAAGLYLGWAGVDRTRMVAQESAISSRLIS